MTDMSSDPTFHWEDFHSAGGADRNGSIEDLACAHREVRAFAGDDPENSWAHCSFCEADLTDQWWAGRDSLRHEYALMPNTLSHIVQIFYRKAES